MRNLLETSRVHFDLAIVLGISTENFHVLASTWDAASDDIFCTYSRHDDGVSLELSRIKSDGTYNVLACWETPEAIRRICDLHHFADTDTNVMVLGNGDLVRVEDGSVEIVGTVDGGILAASWSPDEEVLAICTEPGSLLLMTRDLDPLREITLTAEDLNASKHVNVGWGKAETQFQGKGAKAMKDPTVPENVDQGLVSEFDDGDVVISWRGDGAYFGVSRLDVGYRRVIRVFTREGLLDSVTEPVDGLQHAMSWRPSGNIICGVQGLNEKLDVVFFERNGLRHGGFSLNGRTNENLIGSLAWNSDSSILAISSSEKVQLWTMGNYHWYLKLEFASAANSRVYWHPESPNKLFTCSPDSITSHNISWHISSGLNLSPNDWGIVSVTDGSQLNLTPLRLTNVPPPMCLLSVPVSIVPRDTCISENGRLIAALGDTEIIISEWDFKMVSKPVTSKHYGLHETATYNRQIIFIDESTVCVLGDASNALSTLSVLSVNTGTVTHVIKAPGLVAVIAPIPGQRRIICQSHNGSIFAIDIDLETIDLLFKLPGFCPAISGRVVDGQLCIFSLSETGKLFANERLLANSCTSMYASDAVLMFITSQHLIKFIKLAPDVADLDVPEDVTTIDERCRSVERGSRLICAMPSIYAVVLQMPRGNLETIYPRALVLDGIRRSVSTVNYRRAFMTCRQHRVDLNILHDLNPEQFLQNIPAFIEQLGRLDYIDLVLSQLRDEDVTVTMYPNMGETRAASSNSSSSTSGKVNRICESFIAHIRGSLLATNVQNVITAYCSKSPPDHESALALIATMKGTNQYDEAISHICFLSDVNKLYDTALGTYDLDLTLTIAQHAQKDPREYLPFLQSLQEMDNLRRRFVINDHLGRHVKALKDLHEVGDAVFPEIEKYVVKNALYTEGLELYRYDLDKLKSLTGLYAAYLTAENLHREAGFAYEYLGAHSNAAESFQKAGLWQECLFSAAQIPDSHELDSRTQLRSLAQSLIGELVELKDYSSAARISLDYLENTSEGVRLFCRANKYGEAMRIATVHNDLELLVSVVDPCLIEGFVSTSELIADCKSQLTAQTNRVLELREKKQEDPLAYFDGVTDADAPDDVSLAPTNASTSASLFTRYTGATLATALTGASRKTAKNRRKEERKRARGKKGSVYEEEYLLNSIRRLIERVNSTRQETEHLIECLYRRRMRDNASGLQRQLRELMDLLDNWLPMMFPKVEGDGIDASAAAGAEVVILPTVDAFRNLSLV